MKKQDNIEQAYSGKYINVGNTTYTLVPEVVKGGCQGCAGKSLHNCYKERTEEGLALTKLCRQGYILKKVNT